MSASDQKSQLTTTPTRVIAYGEMTLYQVSDEELRLIEIGGLSSTYLNLPIAFLSSAVSLLFSFLLAGSPTSIYRFTFLMVLLVGTGLAGIILLIIWRRSNKSAQSTIDQIRARAARGIPAGTIIDVPSEQ